MYLGTHCAHVYFHTKLLRFVQQEQFSISLSSLYRRVKDKYVKKALVSFCPFYSLNQQNITFISPLRARLSLSPFEQGLFFNITMGEEKVYTYQDVRYFSWSILTSPIMHWDSCWSSQSKASTHPSCSIEIKTGIRVYFSLHCISIVKKKKKKSTQTWGDESDDYAGYDGSRLGFQYVSQFFWFSLWSPPSDTSQNIGYDITTFLELPSRKLKDFGELAAEKSFVTGLRAQYLALMGESLFVKLHRRVIAFLHSWNPVDNNDKWTQGTLWKEKTTKTLEM